MLFNFFYAYSLWNGLSVASARYNAQAMLSSFNSIVIIYPLLHQSWVASGYKGGVVLPTNIYIVVGPDGPVLRGSSFEGILLGCLQDLLLWDECDPMVFRASFEYLVKERIAQALPSAHFCCRCGSVEGVENNELATAMLNLGGVVEAVDSCSRCRPKQCTLCLSFTNTNVRVEEWDTIRDWGLVDGCQECNEIFVCTQCGDVHYDMNKNVEDLSKAKTVLVDSCHLCD